MSGSQATPDGQLLADARKSSFDDLSTYELDELKAMEPLMREAAEKKELQLQQTIANNTGFSGEHIGPTGQLMRIGGLLCDNAERWPAMMEELKGAVEHAAMAYCEKKTFRKIHWAADMLSDDCKTALGKVQSEGAKAALENYQRVLDKAKACLRDKPKAARVYQAVSGRVAQRPQSAAAGAGGWLETSAQQSAVSESHSNEKNPKTSNRTSSINASPAPALTPKQNSSPSIQTPTPMASVASGASQPPGLTDLTALQPPKGCPQDLWVQLLTGIKSRQPHLTDEEIVTAACAKLAHVKKNRELNK